MCHMLKNMKTKSFIGNKINIIAKGVRSLQLPFIRVGESGEISSQQKPAEKALNVQIVQL